MIRAEQAMRQELARTTLADLAKAADKKAPEGFTQDIKSWFNERWASRMDLRASPVDTESARRRRRNT